MKEVIAIIRPRKVGQTLLELEKLGFPSMTAVSVLGRGRQRGIVNEVNCELPANLFGQAKSGGMKYIPKRFLTMVVPNDDVSRVVNTIIKINQTAQIGDGKIFVCPIEDAVRVRTDEQGECAIL
jgi:nitrogen regulatory protein PII 2